MTDRVKEKKSSSKSNSTTNNNNNNEQILQASLHGSSLPLQAHHSNSSHHSKDPAPARSNEDNLNNDTFIKRYKIIEKIGEGSYSEVLKCQNRQDGTTVACKRLKHIYKSLEDVGNISEIATLRSIQKHANILQMIEIHYDKTLGKVSLVFELMDINLYELIKDRKRLLPESRVRAIMFQLFRALRHLHKLGVFHRDIKPENILIRTKTDQLKLGDLGSVRGMFSRPPYTEYISTRWYRSPECLLTAGHYSHKMDIWAAGCVFYEVLTLRPLFPGSSELDQINRINTVLGPPPVKLLDMFQKQAEMERETYRGQSQLNRRQQIQKILNSYSSRYTATGDGGSSKNLSTNSSKTYRRNNMEFHFAGKEGTGLDKILPAHITREAKEIIKSCLLYDPEQRPTANRVVQLSYFAELRDSYSKNPEKVSSKPVVLICGDQVMDQHTPIELGTLGDHKMRYRRGLHQKTTTSSAAKASSSKTVMDKKSSSTKSTDYNNNIYSKRRCTSSRESVVIAMARASQSRISNLVGSSSSKMKLTTERSSRKPSEEMSHHHERKESSNAAKSSSTLRANRMSNAGSERRSSSKVRSRHSLLASQKLPEQKQTSQQPPGGISSTSSFDSVQSPEIHRERKYSRQRDRSSASKDPSKAPIMTLPDISLSPYVKPPSELKFLRNKIKSDRHKVGAAPLLAPLGGVGVHKPGAVEPQQPAAPPQPQSQMPTPRIAVVPPKVAAAAIKYVKVNNNNRKPRQEQQNADRSFGESNNATTTEQTESSGTHITASDTGDHRRRGLGSAADDSTPYATASSVKIGKLRFRQTSQQQQQQNMKPVKEVPTVATHARSKIPVLTTTEDKSQKSARRSTKILATPPDQRRDRENGTMQDKWRNTGIPRMIPMSPERERNIQLLKESLTLDKNKRLKIRYQDKEQEKDKAPEVQLPPKRSSSKLFHQPQGGLSGRSRMTRKEINSKSNYDYTSNDTLQSTGEQQAGNYSTARGSVGAGRYRNSTTDYENPDAPETSSASAVALENHQRNLFNAQTRKGRVVVPGMEGGVKKPSIPAKKQSSDLYPPEMLHLYSSRYRGPDTNMNILKDSNNNSYIKRPSNAESRTQDVKEKLNHKFEQRRHQQLHQSTSALQVGDHPSKLLSDRSSYAHYSSSLMGAGEEEQFTRAAILGGNRRPPVPPVMQRRGYRDESPGGVQYSSHQPGRRPLVIGPTGGKGDRSHRRSLSNAPPGERAARKEKERMRSTMRDDVFCSSDDDVVMTMRKKFDSLISERARKLSESLKTKEKIPAVAQRNRPESQSDDDLLPSRRSRNNPTDKSKKYARRELRARMAESLTMNSFPVGENWREQLGQGGTLENRVSNESGDWRYVDKSGIGGGGGSNTKQNASSFIQSSVLRARKNEAESEFQDRLKYHQQANRIHPFPLQEQQVYRRGQIFTPPSSTKPSYQSPQVGTLLYDRKFRYSHNNPMSVSGSMASNATGKASSNQIDSLKKRTQRT